MRNLEASVHQRLLNIATRDRVDFNALALRYANERLLYRLAASRHAGAFVLKGATMLLVWFGSAPRRTRDIDLLGYGPPTEERLVHVFSEVFVERVEPDGLVFDAGTLVAEPIREGRSYHGVRLLFCAALGNMRLALQVDIGFGDAVFPPPELVEVPSLLSFPAARLPGYAMETAIAEKFSAMIELGAANSRMKDYYDLWLLSERFTFDQRLILAVCATLDRQGLVRPREAPFGVTAAFAADPLKQMQWRAFVRKAGVEPDLTLAEVVCRAEVLLMPCWSGEAVAQWVRGQGWTLTPSAPST